MLGSSAFLILSAYVISNPGSGRILVGCDDDSFLVDGGDITGGLITDEYFRVDPCGRDFLFDPATLEEL